MICSDSKANKFKLFSFGLIKIKKLEIMKLLKIRFRSRSIGESN